MISNIHVAQAQLAAATFRISEDSQFYLRSTCTTRVWSSGDVYAYVVPSLRYLLEKTLRFSTALMIADLSPYLLASEDGQRRPQPSKRTEC